MTDMLLAAADLLAQNPPRDTGPDFGKASPFGLLVVVLLLVGTIALIWSMNRHLRKLPKSFDEEPDSPPADGTDPEATTDGTKREPGE